MLHPPLQGEGRPPKLAQRAQADGAGVRGDAAGPSTLWRCHPTRRASRDDLPLQGRLEEHVAITMTVPLTSVPSVVTRAESRSPKGHQPATPADGARAVPAGGGSSPPLRAAPGRRPAGMMTGLRLSRWTGTGGERITPAFRLSQEARSGAELRRWLAAASTVVERRQASARRFARAAPVRRGGLD